MSSFGPLHATKTRGCVSSPSRGKFCWKIDRVRRRETDPRLTGPNCERSCWTRWIRGLYVGDGIFAPSVRQAHDKTYELLFEHGLSETFDLVVGADGAWSRVRPLLSSATPAYAGVTYIQFGLDDVDQQHPAVAQLVGHGSMFALADNKGLIAQRNGHGHIRVYAALRVPETWVSASGFDARRPEMARTALLAQFSDWDESLLALIQESNDRFEVRSLYMLPVGHTWDFRAGVTLLGDAAHLMSPFGGEGVNLAMLDAADLARAISECNTLEDAVRTYEETMFARAAIAAQGADEGLTHAIAPDAPVPTLTMLR